MQTSSVYFVPSRAIQTLHMLLCHLPRSSQRRICIEWISREAFKVSIVPLKIIAFDSCDCWTVHSWNRHKHIVPLIWISMQSILDYKSGQNLIATQWQIGNSEAKHALQMRFGNYANFVRKTWIKCESKQQQQIYFLVCCAARKSCKEFMHIQNIMCTKLQIHIGINQYKSYDDDINQWQMILINTNTNTNHFSCTGFASASLLLGNGGFFFWSIYHKHKIYMHTFTCATHQHSMQS